MIVKRLKTIEYGKYYIAVAENNKQFEFAVFYNGKNDKPKIKSFFYSTLEEGEKSIQSDIQALEKAKKDLRGMDNFPSKEEFVECLKYLLDEITDNQLKMLIAHAKKPDRKIYAEELAEITGYKDLGGANMHYGDLGHKICDFLSYKPKEESNNVPVWTFVIASGDYDENKHWYWIMRNELYEALKESNLLN